MIDIFSYPVSPALDNLLQDKTTKQNIIFATDAYAGLGDGYGERDYITKEKLTDFTRTITLQSRVEKAAETQQARTRKKAEVFTPSWIVNKMNNHCDTEWFGRENVFNTEQGQTWMTNREPIVFDGKRTWRKYADSKRIEITCGEAPYIVSRYDAATGEIIPIENRIGILDRKLRVVNENAENDDEWRKWTRRAFESVYGYEFQGDNLLIARINLLMTFAEYYEARFHERADLPTLKKYANIICWNFWQMDGLTGTIPYAVPEIQEEAKYEQLKMLDMDDCPEEATEPEKEKSFAPLCRIMDWRNLKKSVSYNSIKGGSGQ